MIKGHSRKEKIDFLKRISKGQASISELVPRKYEIWFHDPREAPTHFRNGETQQRLLDSELTERARTKHNLVIVRVKYGNRHAPEINDLDDGPNSPNLKDLE